MNLKTHAVEVAKNFYLLRLDDRETKYFESLWYIPEGITYNSYLLVSDREVVLFDTWKNKYSELFVESLRKLVDPEDITRIVVHHTEQDHSGALLRTLEENKFKATVYGHAIVKSLIKRFYGVEPSFKSVNDNELVEVDGYKLRFVHTPWLHWPDTIMTFVESLGILLSGDAFGSYSTPSAIFDDEMSLKELEEYLEYSKKYTITVVGHYKEFIEKNVRKLAELGIEPKVVAPLHGIVWRKHVSKVLSANVKWSRGEQRGDKVTIIYSSMYGNIELAINYIVKKLGEMNYVVKVHGYTDTSRPEHSEILPDIVDSSLLIIGASVYEDKLFPEIENVIRLIVQKTNYSKPVLFIGSYGWGRVFERRARELLEGSNFRVVSVVEFPGRPDMEALSKIDDALSRVLSIR